MLACTRRGRGFIYSSNDSGKAGELSKVTAVFLPVDVIICTKHIAAALARANSDASVTLSGFATKSFTAAAPASAHESVVVSSAMIYSNKKGMAICHTLNSVKLVYV